MHFSFGRRHLSDVTMLAVLLIAGTLLAGWSYRFPRASAWSMAAPTSVVHQQGFYQLEQLHDRPGVYRWTNGRAILKLPNPGGTAVLRVLLAGGPGRTVVVQTGLGDTSINVSVRPEPRNYMLLARSGASERLRLRLDSPTIPVGSRELGIVVGDFRIAGGGTVPALVILALAAATVGVYLLLRQTGRRPLPAAGAAILFQVLALLWQTAGAWRYGLFGSLLALVAGASLAPWVLLRLFPAWPDSEPPAPVFSRVDRRLILLLILGGLCIRLPLLIAFDPVGDLELAARRMGFLHANGLAGAFTADGDYMPLRIYLLLLLSKLVLPLGGGFKAPLPAATLILIKLPGLIADLLTTSLIYYWSRRWSPPRRAALITALYTFAPPVWINVAWWGQVDALLILPLLGLVVLLPRARGRWSWVCWAVALLIKPQAIVLAPLLYAATLRRHGREGLVEGGAIAVSLIVAGCAPLVMRGQGPGLLQAYLGSVGRFPKLTNGAYNLWYLVTLGDSGADIARGLGSVSFRLIGMALMGLVAVVVCLALLRRADGPARAEAAVVLALGFFLLPTQIHERYLFLSLAFVALCMAHDRRMIVVFMGLAASATLNIVGALKAFAPPIYAVMAGSPAPLVIAAFNLLVLGFLIRHFLLVTTGQGRVRPLSLVPSRR